MSSHTPSGLLDVGVSWWVWPTAFVLAAATLVRLGLNADAFGWAAVQIMMVALAAWDIATRRLPNAITIPGSLLAVALRLAFERSELGEVILAGVVALIGFAALSVAVRGGLGMGDVKLAGLLGFLLGSAAVPALVIGTLLGGIAAVVIVARSRASLHAHIAYGPYLAAGGVVAILGFHPPSII